jgi:4-aminobutyrate aminotransferase-like enzyme
VSATSGRGATLHLADGAGASELLDLCSLTENAVLGINDPWVKLRQLSYVLSERPHYVTVRFGCDLYYRVADRLSEHFASVTGSDRVLNIRECTASGAIELALHASWKAAAADPGRRRLASFKGAFHGSNLGGILASDHQPDRGSGRVLVERADNVVQYPMPQVGADGELDAATLDTLDTLDRDGDQYFAVVLEPIPWRNAVHVVPTEFLRRLRTICTERSICLIFDEVQTGFGFTGAISYGEVCGVHPDISVFGKGLTSGHGTLALMVTAPAFGVVESPFGFKSNSANMLSLVAVDAVLDRLLGLDADDRQHLPDWLPPALVEELSGGLLETRYPQTVALVDAMLEDLGRQRPAVLGPPTGLGLMRGLTVRGADGLPSPARAGEVAKVCLSHGVHVRQASTAIFLKPTLAITPSEIDRAGELLLRAVDEVSRHVP